MSVDPSTTAAVRTFTVYKAPRKPIISSRQRNTTRLGEPRDGQATKRKLSQAGLRLFATHGYHLTKVSDIVAECGLTQASFYVYFKTKLELALDLLAQGRDEMVRTLARGYRQAPVTADEMIRNSRDLLRDLLVFCQSNRAFVAILLARGHGVDPKIDRAIAGTREAMYLALRQNIERATELGMLPPSDDIGLRAALVHRLIEGTIEWWLFGHGYKLNHRPTVSAEGLADELVRFEFLGLVGQAPVTGHKTS